MISNLFLQQSLNEEDQKLFRLYGKLPNKKDLLQKKLEVGKGHDSILAEFWVLNH